MEAKQVEVENNNNSKPIPALKPAKKPAPIVLDLDENREAEELIDKAKESAFDLLKELEKKENIDLERIKTLINKIKELKEKHQENEEYQITINEIINRMETKMSAFVNNAPSNINDKDLKELLNNLFPNKVPVSVDLSGIDIKKIVELYTKLQEAIKTGDAKKETAARGRLIKLLKKEQNNIKSAFGDIETIAQIGFELSKDESSLEKIKQLLEQEENKNLYLYFKDYLNDLESLINRYQTVIEDEDIQRLFFLANALPEQLKQHRENLDKRFSAEFLEKKSKLTSIFTELPNAIALSIKKLNNSINELKEAKTQRRKLSSIKQVMKDITKMIGTPILFTGKYIMSNWYTLYMAYQTLTQSIEQAEREKREREEARAKAEAEKARREAKEQARREAAEQARRESKEQARREAEEQARREVEEARREAEEQAQREAEEQARREAEAAAKAKQESEQQVPTPEPTVDPYEHLRNTTFITGVSFGRITPDLKLSAVYAPAGVAWWDFLNYKTITLTWGEAVEIWNLYPGYNFDEIEAEFFYHRL